MLLRREKLRAGCRPERAAILCRQPRRKRLPRPEKAVNMDFFQFIGYIRQFNADVALIGAAVWGLTLLARKTFLKSAKNRKFITFLPFLLGALLYAAYAALCGGAATDWAEALNNGITCGSLATVIEMVYRQFLHGEEKDVRVACVQAMLSGWAQLSDEQAQDLIGTLEQADEERAKAEIAAYTGDAAAETLYPLLQKTLALSDE